MSLSSATSDLPARRKLRLDPRSAALIEASVIPLAALLASALIFSLFLTLLGKDPIRFFALVWTGGVASSFSFQNTLQRAAPLILTGLAFAVPARIGMTLLGAEGALVLGGLASALVAIPMVLAGWPVWLGLPIMALAAMAVGGVWMGIAGWLRHYRGVNETISSLLLTYIAVAIMNFLVEGVFRDPGSTNKASTMPLGPDWRIGDMPGTSVHWGLAAGVIIAVLLWVLMERTTFGFAARIAGGNLRAAQAQGLAVGKLAVASCAIAGACAGLAGFFEVTAVHGQANASLAAQYGFTGILVAFLARQNPLAVVPVALLFGALGASGGLIQRRMDMPDATMLVLQGIIFVTLLVSETLYGRLPFLSTEQAGDRT
ncbi:ABC transporter permease [Celeribacter neptunius]|uniref:Nucleoside ABC transporter membrane protein n=1 Tax=Celeribacter neptunius TaxID=588602 RepID=A0A1I3TEB6_9RHOB|nr:ABC transporter permease [Celeribacter neptunius]SFJ69275.1 nucleoside ABC transporter membrane protein [Celeribacter neptunius]